MILGLNRSDAPALIEASSDTTISFGELLVRGAEVTAYLGVSKQLLFLLCRNDAFTAAVYAGALVARHTVALLDAQVPAQMSAAIVESYRAPWVAGPSGVADTMREQGMSIVSVFPCAGGEVVQTGYSSTGLHPDLAVLLATSGTTGSRKFVRLSRDNVESNARSIADYLGLTPDERPITSLPLHYSFGLSILNSHWLAGAPVVLTTDSVMQLSFWDAFRASGCTSLAGVPYTYQMLERIRFRDMDVPTLRTMQQAGGALDRRLTQLYEEHMARRGGRFFVMYGQTEATARIAYVPPERLSEKLGSAGIAIPGGRLMIEQAPEGPTGEHATGEVVYQGPNVMMGYASGPEELRLGDELQGVLKTGDIGYLDEDGFLFLVGRSKRIAKVFGLRINLDEVELLIREHGPAAAVAGSDVIWVFCAFGTDESVADLADAIARRLRLHPSALRFRRVDSIPTAMSGKIDYQQVQQWVTD